MAHLPHHPAPSSVDDEGEAFARAVFCRFLRQATICRDIDDVIEVSSKSPPLAGPAAPGAESEVIRRPKGNAKNKSYKVSSGSLGVQVPRARTEDEACEDQPIGLVQLTLFSCRASRVHLPPTPPLFLSLSLYIYPSV